MVSPDAGAHHPSKELKYTLWSLGTVLVGVPAACAQGVQANPLQRTLEWGLGSAG